MDENEKTLLSGANTQEGSLNLDNEVTMKNDTTTNIPDSIFYRDSIESKYSFKDVVGTLNNNTGVKIGFTTPKMKVEDVDHVGMLTTGAEVKGFKLGYFWAINGFDKRKYKNNALFRSKGGIGARSVNFIQGLTTEVDNRSLEDQAAFWTDLYLNHGLEPFCVTNSGEGRTDVLESFRDALVKREHIEAYDRALASNNIRKGKSFHVSIRIKPIQNPTEDQRTQYSRIAQKFAIIASGDLAVSNLDRLMRAPGTYLFDNETGQLCVQPIVYFNENAKQYTLGELESIIDRILASLFGNLNLDLAIDCLRVYNNLSSPKKYGKRLHDPNGVLMAALKEIEQHKVIPQRTLNLLKNIRAASTAVDSNTVVLDLSDFENRVKGSVSISKKGKCNLKPVSKRNKTGGRSYYCSSETLVHIPKRGNVSAKTLLEEGFTNIPCHCPFHGWTDPNSTNASFNRDPKKKPNINCYCDGITYWINDDMVPVTLDSLEDFDLKDVALDYVLHTTYDYKNIKRYPIVLPTRKLTLLNGPCGVGKTYAVSRVVASLIAQEGKWHLLHASFRTTLVGQAIASYAGAGLTVASYKDNGGMSLGSHMAFCIDSLMKHNLLTVEEVDGMFRVLGEQPNMIIVLDEITQVFKSLLGQGSQIQPALASKILEKLREYVSRPTTIIFGMDADLDDYSIEIIKRALDLKDSDIEISGFKNYEYEHSYKLVPSEEDLLLQFEAALASGLKVSLACSSKEDTKIYYERFIEKYPNKKDRFYCFNQDTKEELIAQGCPIDGLDMPGVPWIQETDLLIYSPTFQAGVSIVETFDKQFGIFKRGHTLATDIFQMTRRCRNLNDKVIEVFIEDGGAYKTVNAQQLKANFELYQGQIKNIYNIKSITFSKEELEDIENTIQNCLFDDKMRDLWIMNKCRDRLLGGEGCRLKAAFIEACEEKGIGYDIMDPATSIKVLDPDLAASMRKKKKEIKHQLKLEHKDNILNANDISFEEAKNMRIPKSQDEVFSKSKAFAKYFFGMDLNESLVDLWLDRKKMGHLKGLAARRAMYSGHYYKIVKGDITSAHFGGGRDGAFKTLAFAIQQKIEESLNVRKVAKENFAIFEKLRTLNPDDLEYQILSDKIVSRTVLDSDLVKQVHASLKRSDMKKYEDLGFYVTPKKDAKDERPFSRIIDLLESYGLVVGLDVKTVVASLNSDVVLNQLHEFSDATKKKKRTTERTYFIDWIATFEKFDLVEAEYKRLCQTAPVKTPTISMDDTDDVLETWLKGQEVESESVEVQASIAIDEVWDTDGDDCDSYIGSRIKALMGSIRDYDLEDDLEE
jgi:hypothetical protein